MFRKLTPAFLGLIVLAQASTSFAGGTFFPHHSHNFYKFHYPGHFAAPPLSRVVHQPQFVVVRKWTPAGWVLVKQPVGGAFIRF